MKQENKRLNLSINDGMDFFAHEVSVNYNPTQFIFDFKSITPRMDPRNQDGATISLKHNVVLIDAYHAKRFHELLGKVLSGYEKELGKIEKPKAISKAEKKRNKNPKGKKEKVSLPSYLG
ncbi:DUF3467 domain-containing protein [Candidatus Woesearchaeota archaeon]|nr:DUF3467 domain-containing protein [Candidatus Woesearchaeota archaeon]